MSRKSGNQFSDKDMLKINDVALKKSPDVMRRI
jgi:hypothetical protein